MRQPRPVNPSQVGYCKDVSHIDIYVIIETSQKTGLTKNFCHKSTALKVTLKSSFNPFVSNFTVYPP